MVEYFYLLPGFFQTVSQFIKIILNFSLVPWHTYSSYNLDVTFWYVSLVCVKECSVRQCQKIAPFQSCNTSHVLHKFSETTAVSEPASAHTEIGIRRPRQAVNLQYAEILAHMGCFCSGLSCYRITESQNHRIVGVGRDLCGSSSPTPPPKQGHLQ